GARAFAWSALVAQNARTVALVAPSEDRARRWRAELAGWLGEERVLAFPERETMPFEASAPSGTAVHQRLLTLWRLATAQAPVAVVTGLRALLEHTIPPEELARRGRTLRAGDRLSWAETAAWLFDLGYEPVTEVSEPGTFSRRGGIIDIYPASAEQPARVELFGDEIETLRAFDPVTQRSRRRPKSGETSSPPRACRSRYSRRRTCPARRSKGSRLNMAPRAWAPVRTPFGSDGAERRATPAASPTSSASLRTRASRAS